MSLPGASELFRATHDSDAADATPNALQPAPVAPEPSGRVRHDEKITVYVSSDELIGLEEARLALRRQGLAVDRGRIVRAAIALAMADLAEHGVHGALVDRLRQS